MWSFEHIVFIISPFLVTVILYLLTKNASFEKKRILGIILSVYAVLLLLLRNIEIYYKSDRFQPEIIPLQICHFANFVLLFAFLFRNNTLFAVAFCFNLPFAFMSILFANSLENYTTFWSFRVQAYIFGHLLIVAITLWAFVARMFTIDKKNLSRGLLFILTLFLLSVPINNLFNHLMPDFTSNYFYTIEPEGGTPLELAYNWGKVVLFLGMEVNLLYVLITACFGIVIYLTFYLLYRLALKSKAHPAR